MFLDCKVVHFCICWEIPAGWEGSEPNPTFLKRHSVLGICNKFRLDNCNINQTAANCGKLHSEQKQKGNKDNCGIAKEILHLII